MYNDLLPSSCDLCRRGYLIENFPFPILYPGRNFHDYARGFILQGCFNFDRTLVRINDRDSDVRSPIIHMNLSGFHQPYIPADIRIRIPVRVKLYATVCLNK